MRTASLFVGCLFLVSCSSRGGLHPVQGKVSYKGEPIAGAVVVFHPRGTTSLTAQRPSGVTGADGVFHLTTGKEDGAPVGEYDVTVTWPGDLPRPAGKKPVSTDQNEPERPDRLNGRYATAKTSQLSATVKAGGARLEPFALK